MLIDLTYSMWNLITKLTHCPSSSLPPPSIPPSLLLTWPCGGGALVTLSELFIALVLVAALQTGSWVPDAPQGRQRERWTLAKVKIKPHWIGFLKWMAITSSIS